MSEERIRFKCTSCNWKFKRSREPKICPYCGEENTIAEDTREEAQEIIEEIEEAQRAFEKRDED